MAEFSGRFRPFAYECQGLSPRKYWRSCFVVHVGTHGLGDARVLSHRVTTWEMLNALELSSGPTRMPTDPVARSLGRLSRGRSATARSSQPAMFPRSGRPPYDGERGRPLVLPPLHVRPTVRCQTDLPTGNIPLRRYSFRWDCRTYHDNNIPGQYYQKVMPRIQIPGWRCERCSHVWTPRRKSNTPPTVCPKCKSPYWNTPRKKDKKQGEKRTSKGKDR